MMKKRIFPLLFAVCFCFACMFPIGFAGTTVLAAPVYSAEPNARSCILMDGKTGAILYEYNADEALPPASVTKVMTMLLVFEALAEGTLTLEQTVCISETAASMFARILNGALRCLAHRKACWKNSMKAYSLR